MMDEVDRCIRDKQHWRVPSSRTCPLSEQFVYRLLEVSFRSRAEVPTEVKQLLHNAPQAYKQRARDYAMKQQLLWSESLFSTYAARRSLSLTTASARAYLEVHPDLAAPVRCGRAP